MNGPDDLRRGTEDLRSQAGRLGRAGPLDVRVTPFGHPRHRAGFDPDALLEEAARLAELGMTWPAVRLPAPTRAEFQHNVERFGEQVVGSSGVR